LECPYPIFCDFLEEQRTINSLYYSNMIKDKVKPALKRKCPEWQRPGVLLLQDNARPHTAQLETLETIGKVGWELLPHPLYSHDPFGFLFVWSDERIFAWHQVQQQ